MSTQVATSTYGERVLKIEPYGIEQVSVAERHGTPRQQFSLWLGSNLTIADFALGFLPITLGLPWFWTIAAILIGNLLGAAVLAGCAAMGPTYGAPQLIIGRYTFGKLGGYLPGLLNYVSTIGWFTVNNILGAFGLKVLFPALAFWQGALLLVVLQGLLAVFGHNLIHTYERVMSVILGTMFLIASVTILFHHTTLHAYQPSGQVSWSLIAVVVAAVFSYVGSWGPYASDYSRYLPTATSKQRVFGWAFLGSLVASIWLELVGAGVAVLAGPHHGNPIAALHSVMGVFGALAVIAIILGGTAADALNLYSNALSAGSLGLRLPRWVLAVIASVIGLVLSLTGAGGFEHNYEDFLLMLGYWMTPWVGILFCDFYVLKRHRFASTDKRHGRRFGWSAIISFLAGILVSIPFMNGPFYEGSAAKSMHGADLSFYVGFFAAALIYLLIQRATPDLIENA